MADSFFSVAFWAAILVAFVLILPALGHDPTPMIAPR